MKTAKNESIQESTPSEPSREAYRVIFVDVGQESPFFDEYSLVRLADLS